MSTPNKDPALVCPRDGTTLNKQGSTEGDGSVRVFAMACLQGHTYDVALNGTIALNETTTEAGP